MSKQVELMVVRKDQLDALINAAGNVLHSRQEGEVESIVQDEFLRGLKSAVDVIASRGVIDSMRHVEASGVDADEPILVIIPPDMDDAMVVDEFASAVLRAASISADGEGTGYFESLSDSLASSGVAIVQEIRALDAGPWDISKNPAEPYRVDDDDPEWVCVRVSGPGFIDLDVNLNMELLDGAKVDLKTVEFHKFLGFVTNLTYTFPRGDRYGVPEEATDSGARAFVADELGYACSRSFEVMGVDSRDDTPASFVAECLMPRDILMLVDRPSERMTN